MWPPKIAARPSASETWAEQKRLRPYGTCWNAPVAGFQTRSESTAAAKPSYMRTLPLRRSIMCTGTRGHSTGSAQLPTTAGSLGGGGGGPEPPIDVVMSVWISVAVRARL